MKEYNEPQEFATLCLWRVAVYGMNLATNKRRKVMQETSGAIAAEYACIVKERRLFQKMKKWWLYVGCHEHLTLERVPI